MAFSRRRFEVAGTRYISDTAQTSRGYRQATVASQCTIRPSVSASTFRGPSNRYSPWLVRTSDTGSQPRSRSTSGPFCRSR
uniref:Uncharacterized protein n=1 Tax=uncultured marine virus TaxID=186617 RepID=A0A0F7L788_9VIRU|nr:hypothetical protein [uncultured marine virus]